MQVPQINFNHKKVNNAHFEVLDLEELHQRSQSYKHSPEQPHRVTFFTAIYIEQGNGNHMIDFVECPFEDQTVIFVQREQVHSYDFSGLPKGKVLVFTQEFLDQLHANMRLPSYTPTHLDAQYQPSIQLSSQLAESCNTLIREIGKEVKKTDYDPLVVMYLFSAFSLLLQRERPIISQDRMSKEQNIKFARFFDLLKENFSTIRDANWYANKAHTTYKTLNLVCKLATNMTAKQVIDAFTIVEIKRRLVLNTGTTQQLAYELGFEDASNFVKYFKKNVGLTPTQFQNKYITPYL